MKKFKKIYIEITNNCNLSCSFCSINNRKKEFMSLNNFKEILNEIKDYTDYIYLHVKGEPLIYPYLNEILKLCTINNIKVNVTTNGTLLKQKKDILLENKCIRQINISLHSENNKEHYLEEIFDTVQQLSEDIIVIYRFWTLKDLKLNEKSIEIVDKINEYYNLDYNIMKDIFTKDNIKIKNNIYISKDNRFVWPDLSNDYTNCKGYCQALKTHIAILVDGTVVPCCLDSDGIINLGNIYQTQLKTILESERAQTIRTNFNNRKAIEELCKHCSFKERFDKINK